MRTHARRGRSLFIQLGRDRCTDLFPFPIWCVKSGRKSMPFPSFWPLWLVVPRGCWGETGSKVSDCQVCAAPRVAKNNRGNGCWTAPTTGRGIGRRSKSWIVIQTARRCRLFLGLKSLACTPLMCLSTSLTDLFHELTQRKSLSSSDEETFSWTGSYTVVSFPLI